MEKKHDSSNDDKHQLVVERSPTAALLMTPEGLLNAYAELYMNLKDGGGSRDFNSAQTSCKRILDAFKDAQKEEATQIYYDELGKGLYEVKNLVETTTGGSATSFDKPADLPREVSPGTN